MDKEAIKGMAILYKESRAAYGEKEHLMEVYRDRISKLYASKTITAAPAHDKRGAIGGIHMKKAAIFIRGVPQRLYIINAPEVRGSGRRHDKERKIPLFPVPPYDLPGLRYIDPGLAIDRKEADGIIAKPHYMRALLE